jgi:hypothetical protein
MASVLKVISASLVTLFAVLAFTVVYVLFLVRGTQATSFELLQVYTIRSPLYWLLVAALLAALWWLFRGWLKS